jgi:uncharacterized protein (UPF0264 family)
VQLLVSVCDAAEARAALEGGADIIDAKDPMRGALGALPLGRLRQIREAVGDERPLSAALGDAARPADIERATRAAAAVGAMYVKVGFFGIQSARRAAVLLGVAVHASRAINPATGVVAVAYADVSRTGSPPPSAMIDLAERAGAVGVLLDTAFKDVGGLVSLMPPSVLAEWVAAAHAASLVAALAGKLTAEDLALVRGLGADIAGVRGAACDGGRGGRVSTERVRALLSGAAPQRELVRSTAAPAV